MLLSICKKYSWAVFLLGLSGCYSEAVPQIEYSEQSARLIKFTECKWSRLNLVCMVKNLKDREIPQRRFLVTAVDKKGDVVFEELIKPSFDPEETVEKWFESFKSRDRVVKLIVNING